MSVQVPFTDNQSVVGRLLRDTYNWLIVLVAINILWLLTSLTVLLLPPATAGLFHIARQVTRGEGPTVSAYLSGVYRWLWPSLLWGLLLVVWMGLALLAMAFYASTESAIALLLFGAVALLTLFFTLIQCYFWPYMMIQERPNLVVAQRNAAYTLLGAPFPNALYASLALVWLGIGVVLVIPFAVISPVMTALWLTYTLIDWLKKQGLLPQTAPDPGPAEY
jgi:hypothetical protein